jgi:hypothetical protein
VAILVAHRRDLEKYVPREEAEELYKYLELGGILRIEKEEGRFRVVYPTKQMIRDRIKELEEKRKEIKAELNKLSRIKKKKPSINGTRLKHIVLKRIDKDYRELAEAIDADRLLRDEKERKIVEELQKNKEFRERLRITLKESPVYKDRKFGEFVEKSQEVKGNLLGGRAERLQIALQRVEEEINILKGIERWM